MSHENVKGFVVKAIQPRMKKDKFPNKLTLETIEKAENKIGLYTYDTIQEFIDDMRKAI